MPLKYSQLYVMGGVARRAWARNENALATAAAFNEKRTGEHITLPYLADEAYLTELAERRHGADTPESSR